MCHLWSLIIIKFVSLADIDKDEEEVLEQSNRIRFSRQPEEKFDICHDKSGSQLQSLQVDFWFINSSSTKWKLLGLPLV